MPWVCFEFNFEDSQRSTLQYNLLTIIIWFFYKRRWLVVRRGSATGVYDFIKRESGFVPYDTCQPYIACSTDNTDGFCPHVDTTCNALNTCRTCDGTGECHAITRFPNASIAEYGTYSYFTAGFSAVTHKIKAEIFARGPVAAGVNADPLVDYTGGIVNNTAIWNMMVNHIVSIVGWGYDEEAQTEVSHYFTANYPNMRMWA